MMMIVGTKMLRKKDGIKEVKEFIPFFFCE